MERTAGRLARKLDDLPAAVLPVTVGLAALVLRLWTLAEERAGNPLYRLAILDDRVYLDLAGRVLETSTPAAPWFLAPLYPWVLAQVGRFLPLDMSTACGLAVVLGTCCAMLVAAAARDVHSQAAGFVAGLLYAAAGTFVFHDTLPGQEPLLCVLTVLSLWAAIAWCRSGHPWLAALTGLAVGTAMLGRATAVTIALAVAWPAWRALRPRGRLLRGAALLTLGLGAVLVPAAVRNHAVAGRLSPFPWSSGPNLYAANGPAARAVVNYAVHELGGSPDAMERESRRLAEEAAGRDLGPYEVSDHWRAQAWAGAGASTLARHLAKKAALFWAADEYGSNHSVDVERRFATWLRLTPVSGWWLLVLGLAGWVVARKRRPELDVAALHVALLWAMLSVVYPVSRYRLPALVAATLCAGCGSADLLRGAVTRGRLRAAGGLALVATLLALAAPGLRARVLPGYTYRNIAAAYMAEGRAADARAVLEEALVRAPEDAVARVAMARLLVEGGEPGAAIEHLLAAQHDGNVSLPAALLLLDALSSVGRAREALALRDRLLSARAGDLAADATFWACSARVEWAHGRRAVARDHLQRARTIDPAASAVRRAEAELAR